MLSKDAVICQGYKASLFDDIWCLDGIILTGIYRSPEKHLYDKLIFINITTMRNCQLR